MNILIVKSSALGDIVHAFPCISYIKDKAPGALIDWVVEKPFLDLVKSHPDVNEVFSINTKAWKKNLLSKKAKTEIQEFVSLLRKKKYDVVFDLQGNTKSAVITALSKSCDKIGFARKDVPEWPNLLATNKKIPLIADKNIRADYLHLVKSYFGDFEEKNLRSPTLRLSSEEKEVFCSLSQKLGDFPKPWILVCPGSNWENKRLCDKTLQSFLHLVHKDRGGSFFFTWGSEQEKSQALNLQSDFLGSCCLPKLSLPLLQNAMALMDLVIAVDSLPLHLAATTDTATFSVFGASSAKKYAPKGHQHRSFQGECPYGYTFDKRCHLLRKCKTGSCIRSLSPETIFEAFK